MRPPTPPDGGLALAAALLGAVLGPALQLQQEELWSTPHYAGLLLAGLAAGLSCVRLHWRHAAARALAWALCTTCLAAGLTGWRAAAYLADALDPALEGEDLELTGMVAAMPHRLEAGLRLRFAVEEARGADGAAVRLPPQVQLAWYAPAPGQTGLRPPPPEVQPGERWRLTARLKAPHGLLNPHGFDYELWLWEQGLQATGHVRDGPRDPPPELLEATWRHPVERARHRVRERILERVADARAAGVLAALVMGDQGAIERADWEVFRATGVAHLMSISGLHVTMFAWGAALAVGALWRRRPALCLAWPAQHAALVGGVVLAAGYALFSGWGVPAQRTVWMLGTVAALRLLGREWPWPWTWLLACAVVVTADPWALVQPGFWLSFVAVGVLFASGRPRPAAARGRVVQAALAMLREQWVVTLALTPLALLLFGQVSLVGLLANLVAIPAVTVLVTPLGLAGVLLPPLWQPAAQAVGALATGAQWLAALPHATWSAPAAPFWVGITAVAGGTVLVLRLPPSLRLLGLPWLLPALLWQPARPPPGAFELLAADIGQGNAVLVRTARHALLYDAGPDAGRGADAGERVLVPLLRALGVQLDLLMLSHRDSDHTGGAAAVLAAQPGAILASSLEDGHPLAQRRPGSRCLAGQRWTWDGVEFELLHPLAADYDRRAKPNAVSCVLRVSAGRVAALLPGDIERAQEAALLARGAPLRADWLLVPHHGSRSSSSAVWLAAVQPALALVQAGYRNRFGHPAQEVLVRYQQLGTRVVTTEACGAAHWRSLAPGELRCQRQLARRYWHHRPP